jgi:queuosine precursor transporter
MTRRQIGIVFAAAYIGAIIMANWLIVHVGFIRVWPTTLMAPAGVYMAGLTFPARDIVQRSLGRAAGVLAILAAAGITYMISPVLAFASGLTFLVSETLDMAIYTPLQRRLFRSAVIVSSSVAAVVDSLLFLYLAHIPYNVALAGQIVGKLEVVWLCGIPMAFGLRRVLPLRPDAAPAAG